MAGFNGSGTFVRTYNWVTDKGNSVKVTASRMDTEDDGFATGLSSVIAKDGQTTTTAMIPFAAGAKVSDGAVGTPSLAFINDTDCGLYRIGANNIGLAVGGAKVWDYGTATASAAGSLVMGGTVAVVGAVTGASVAVSGALTSSSSSAGSGYTTGAGGTVTQLTDKSTAVTINKVCGNIVTANSLTTLGGLSSFTVNNSTVAAGDVIVASVKSGGTADRYFACVLAVAGGSFSMGLFATIAESAAITINFAVIKAVAA